MGGHQYWDLRDLPKNDGDAKLRLATEGPAGVMHAQAKECSWAKSGALIALKH